MGLNLECCNFDSLNELHQHFCKEAGKYVSPVKTYKDQDGIIHDPNYRNPRLNPENFTTSGIYQLDFTKKWQDPEFRRLLKRKYEIENEPV